MCSEKIEKSPGDWKEFLDEESYRVCRLRGTEQPFSGKYDKFTKDGKYLCKCCNQALFDSEKKYDAKTGWPSFTAPKSEKAIATKSDERFGVRRVEVVCSRCDAHLGHVFDNDPDDGKRYCINSVALNFEPRSGAK
jgi:peptide-methionine (R)-S-oxide reductase